jgi:uncharacterized protein
VTPTEFGSDERVGVVIPTLNEEAALPKLLADLSRIGPAMDVVVVDGGSEDRTCGVAAEWGARCVRTEPGRARQMNLGASLLDTPWILFLHADSRLPVETARAIEDFVTEPRDPAAAHFSFRLDAEGPWWWLIERGQRIRERLTGLAYGDQGLLVSRTRFDRIGGFPDVPLMEDVAIVRRLRATGGLGRIEAPLVTSARRYREEGPFVSWIRNAALITLYSAGVPPRRLVRWYRAR